MLMRLALPLLTFTNALVRGNCVLASSHHSARVTTKTVFIVIAPCECDPSDDLDSYQTAVRCHPRRPWLVPHNNFALTWVWFNISHHPEGEGAGDLGPYPRRVRGRPRLHNTSHFCCWERVTTTNKGTLELVDDDFVHHTRHTRAGG